MPQTCVAPSPAKEKQTKCCRGIFTASVETFDLCRNGVLVRHNQNTKLKSETTDIKLATAADLYFSGALR